MRPNDGRVVSNFIIQALNDAPLTVFGDGKQTRSFCYIDDIVDGFLQMMNSSDNFVGPLNLGNSIELSIIELAHLIIDLTDSKSEIIHMQLPQDDPLRRQPDVGLAKRKLSWEPKVSLEQGLIKTIDYFKCISE
jgi:UDP-glucuronate decarboxylase